MQRPSQRLWFDARLAVLLTVIAFTAGGTVPAMAVPMPSMPGSASPAKGAIERVHGWHCEPAYGMNFHYHRKYGHTHPYWHRHPGSCYHGRTHKPYHNAAPMFHYPPGHPRWKWRGRRPRGY